MRIREVEYLYEGNADLDGGASFFSGLSSWEQGVLTAASLEDIALSEIPLSKEQVERLRAYDNQLRMLTEDARYLLCLTTLSALEVPDDG